MSVAGGPRIDVPTIERRLRDLWKGLAEVSQRDEVHPVMRASVLNLLVFAPGEGAEFSVTQNMGIITRNHPGRILVLTPIEDKTSDEKPSGGEGEILDARVTALCHPFGRHKQICCELILIRCSQSQLSYLASLVQPLLEADLPRVLWWRDAPAFGFPLFDQLVEIADRVILDSGMLDDGMEGMARLAESVHATPKTRFTDLAWSRLTPWRVGLAEIFDVDAHRGHIGGIRRVEIEYEAGKESRGPASEAALLGGWLAGRFGWRLEGVPQMREDKATELRLNNGQGGSVTMIFQERDGRAFHDRLGRVRLETSGPSFEVECKDPGHLEASAGDSWTHRIMRTTEEGEARMVSRELEILGHDRVYEEVLSFYVELGKRI